MAYTANTFILPYQNSDKVLSFQTSINKKVGGMNVCQYSKASTEGKELWIITSLGKIIFEFANDNEAKLAQTKLNIAIDLLLNNCNIGTPAPIVHYVHTQAILSTVWTINHNLNYYPSVTIVDATNKVMLAEITYIDANNLNITFSPNPKIGKAFLN